jgi:hypothetical protein
MNSVVESVESECVIAMSGTSAIRSSCGKFSCKRSGDDIGLQRHEPKIGRTFNQKKSQCEYAKQGHGCLTAHAPEDAQMEHLIKMHNYEKCGFREWLYKLQGDQPYTFEICGVGAMADENWQVDEAIRMTRLCAALLRTTPLYQSLVDNDLYAINSSNLYGRANIPSLVLALFAVLKAKEVKFSGERYDFGHPMELVWNRSENNPRDRVYLPAPHMNSCRDRFYRAVFQQNKSFNQFCGSEVDAFLPQDFYTKSFDLEKQKKVMQWTATYFKIRIIMLVIDSQNTKFCGCTRTVDKCKCNDKIGMQYCHFCTVDMRLHPDPWLLEFDGTDNTAVVSMEEPVILVRECVVRSFDDNTRSRDHEYRWTGVSIACQCDYGSTARELQKNVTHIKRMWQATRRFGNEPWKDGEKVWGYRGHGRSWYGPKQYWWDYDH